MNLSKELTVFLFEMQKFFNEIAKRFVDLNQKAFGLSQATFTFEVVIDFTNFQCNY